MLLLFTSVMSFPFGLEQQAIAWFAYPIAMPFIKSVWSKVN